MSYTLTDVVMKEVITVDLDPGTRRQLVRLASEQGVSMTAFAEQALRAGLALVDREGLPGSSSGEPCSREQSSPKEPG